MEELSSGLSDTALMIARGQYSTLRKDAGIRLQALARQWDECNASIRDALSYRANISDCRPAAKIEQAYARMEGMVAQAAELERICEQIAGLRNTAWGGEKQSFDWADGTKGLSRT